MTHKAFVSSTFEDLQEHRAYVIEALGKAEFSVDPMENWTAATTEPKELSQARMKDCDLCVLLVALRRGHVAEGEDLSITQLEWKAAIEKEIKVLVFMLDEEAPWPRQFDELDKDPELKRWRAELRETYVIGSFQLDPKSIEIAPALTRWIAEKGGQEAETRPADEPGQDRSWFQGQIERAQKNFAGHTSGGQESSVELAAAHFVELLVQNPGPAESSARPFSELIEKPGSRFVVFGDGGSGKSTSLLKLAIDAGQRALEDPNAPIPLYARLNFFDTADRGLDRLMEIIGEPAEMGAAQLRELWRKPGRPLLILLDGFNEVAPDFQPACVLALSELLQVGRHSCLITSRPCASIDALVSDQNAIQTKALVALDEDQIQDFLARHDAAELYDRMGDDLKTLSGNPLMLWALAQSCKKLPPGELPSNKGRLFSNFVDHYIFEERESKKIPAPTRYNYERVKKPILAQLALAMTREGVTRRHENLPILDQIWTQMQEIRAKLEGKVSNKAHDLMPRDSPTAKDLLDEIVHNGVLQRIGDTFEFMHQSVQDYFATLALLDLPLSSILEEVPEAKWVRSETVLINEQETPLRESLVMLSGLSESSDELVRGMINRDTILTSDCLVGAHEVSDETRSLLEKRWLALLRSDDQDDRYCGCKAARISRVQTDDVLDSFEKILLAENEWSGNRIAVTTAIMGIESTRVVPMLFEALGQSEQDGVFLIVLLAGISQQLGNKENLLLMALAGADVWRAAAKLYRDRRTTEQLVQMMLESKNWQPPFVLLKLIHKRTMSELLTQIINNREPLHQKALSLFALLNVTKSAAETLFDILDADEGESGVPGGQQVLAALGLADLCLQEQSTIIQTPDALPSSELMRSLERRMKNLELQPDARVAAALGLARASDEEEFEALLQHASDSSTAPAYRMGFCYLILAADRTIPFWLTLAVKSKFRADRAREFLVERALDDEDAAVRSAAVDGLKPDYKPETGESRKLLEALNSGKSELQRRQAAAEALATLGDKAGRNALVDILDTNSEHDELRGHILIPLSRFDDEETASILENRALASEDPKVRTLSALVYYVSRRQTALDRFAEVSLDPEHVAGERYQAVSALYTIGDHNQLAVEVLWQIVLSAPEDSLRAHAVVHVHALKPEETLAELTTALLDPDREDVVREAAAVGLGCIGSDEATATLEEIRQNHSDRFATGSAVFGLRLGAIYREEEQSLPTGASRLLSRVASHWVVGNMGYALTDLNQLVTDDPDNSMILGYRAVFLSVEGRYDEAIVDAVRAAELSPEEAVQHTNLGYVLRAAGHVSEAGAAYRRGLELDSDSPEAHDGIAFIESEMGHHDAALQSAHEAARLAPENADYQASVGWYAYQAGEFSQSIAGSRRALELEPDMPSVMFNLGLALLAIGDLGTALEQYQAAGHVCRSLQPDEAATNLKDGIEDIEKLILSRPDVSSVAGIAKQRLEELLDGLRTPEDAGE